MHITFEFQNIIHTILGDDSAASNLTEAEVDKRMHLLIDMEDPDVIPDLRHTNNSSASTTKYELFWNACDTFLNEETAADERRHDVITHMARAISLRDLRSQVTQLLPPNTPVPSLEWIRLQFWPKSKSLRSLQNTGRFQVKYMVQQRQLRHSHVDSHYAACIFRYIREYAIICHEFCNFICLDDKHRIKVGEPGVPVASVERGRQVLVSRHERMIVADHDFTKFSIIPSVIFRLKIPEDISDSWYNGQVYVGFKDAIFEPSNPVRHAAEVYSVLAGTETPPSPVLFLYTDGGPDHRLTYVSVQISLVCLFKKLDLDFLCAARTAPYQSWKNPVERLMSIINLGLQSVGIARDLVAVDIEEELKKCNSMSQVRKLAEKNASVVGSVKESLSSVVTLLDTIMTRLMLKDIPFKNYSSATVAEIEEFWNSILNLEATLKLDDKVTKKNVADYSNLCNFLQHCCSQSHYSFDILKCGSSQCNYCSPPRLPMDVFVTLQHLPLPTPGCDNHYKSFSEVYGTKTSEEHRPSLTSKSPKKTVPFPTSVQHAKNTNIMVMCEECDMWRLVYCQTKLSSEQREYLQSQLDHHSFSCGADLSNLELHSDFPFIYVRNLKCNDLVERLYYSAKYSPICIYCAADVPVNTPHTYPQCQDCTDMNRPLINKKSS